MTNTEAAKTELAEYTRLIDSHWSTANLAHMALAWYETSAAIIAGTAAPAKPIWSHISSDEESAREFYETLDTESLREMACDALVSSGWTLSSINHRRS